MKKIMEQVDTSIDIYPKNGSIEFLSMPEFRKELIKLLKFYSFPNRFCKDDNYWLDFLKAMTQVLADQPIVNPTANISEFYYVDMNKEGIMATINFKGKKSGTSITLGFGA
jgi:hypothetical protein